MTKEQELICDIAKQIHRYGCDCNNCEFNPNLESYQDWQNPSNKENLKFLECARNILSLLWENDISYPKFIRVYSRLKKGKHVNKKMKNIMDKYQILL